MTALNQSYTTEYNLQTGARRVPSGQYDAGLRIAQLREAYVTGQGTVNALILPPGNLRIWTYLCRLSTENATWTNVGVTLVLGYAAYTDNTGTAQAASNNAFVTSQTPQAGALAIADFSTGIGVGVLYKDFNTQNGLTVTYTTGTADKAAADILSLQIAFQYLGIGT